MSKLLLLFGALLALGACQSGPPATGQPAAGAEKPAAASLPQYYVCGRESEAEVLAAIQRSIVLPLGTPVPAENSRVVVQLLVGKGSYTRDVKITQGLGPDVNQAVERAVRDHLPQFCARYDYEDEEMGGNDRRYWVPYPLTIRAPGAATPAQRREATTRAQQTAVRLPGEADSTFMQRVLPLSYPVGSCRPAALAWRPSAFGQQLFFTQPSCEKWCGHSTFLLVLDPYRAGTYAVQQLVVPSQGDDTNLADLFLADVDRDGRQDLVAIGVCCLRGDSGCHDTYRTQVWHYLGLDAEGRPRYESDDTERPYLDDLPTAAAVRRALARHWRRMARARRPAASPAAPDTAKPARAASPPESGPGQ